MNKKDRRRSSLSKPKSLWRLSDLSNPVVTKQVIRHPTDITFLSDDYIVVADSEGHKLPIFDLSGRVRSVIANNAVWPNSVCTTREGHIVVTDRKKHLIKLYDVVTGQCIHAWGEKIHVGEEEIDLKPHGVAFDSYGRIVVTETLQSKVKFFSTEGKKLNEFGGKGDNVHNLVLPFYVAVDKDSNITVSDNMNDSIKIYNRDGNFLKKIGSAQDWGKKQLNCVYGIAVGRRGHVVVADHGNDRLVAYENDGSYVGEVVSKSDECLGPCGLAINSYGHLAFTECTRETSNIRMLYAVDMHNDVRKQRAIEEYDEHVDVFH